MTCNGTLSILPIELIAQILENTDYRTLLACTQVCSRMKAVIDGTASLQYIIELAIRGQKDGAHKSATSSVDRLRQLDKHTSAWKNLTWSREIRIPGLRGGLWELFGGVLGQSTPDNQLVFYQLPSDLRGIEERSWSLGPDFGVTVHDFAMDPHQDLLVLIEDRDDGLGYYAHLRTLSTGTLHPFAKQKTLRCYIHEGEHDEESGSCDIQIFGGLIGILFVPELSVDNHMGIWDWKTGELLMDFIQEGLESFSLLSIRYIALALYDYEYALVVVDFRNGPSERHDIYDRRVAVYCFEYPFKDVMRHSVQLRADPGPMSAPKDSAPFHQDTQNFLLVFTLHYSAQFCPLKTFRQFIPSQHLISLVESNPQGRLVKWDWILNTRLYVLPQADFGDGFVCYVYGSRFVTYEEALNGTPKCMVRLYDFNQLAVRRDAQEPDRPDTSGSIESLPNKILGLDLFSHDVDTSLPYWTNVASLEDNENLKVMCSEDSIVVVDPKEFRVLVF